MHFVGIDPVTMLFFNNYKHYTIFFSKYLWISQVSLESVGLESTKKFYFFKIGLSTYKKCYLLDWNPFKGDEKCFLFNLKSSFHSQDI